MDFSWSTVLAIAGIIWTDLALAGDNALVIGMAAQKLPKKLRFAASIFGAIAAIGLRILFILFVVQLLQIPLIKAIGGLALLCVVWRLTLPTKPEQEKEIRTASGIWEAIWIIAGADFIMSLDNVIAIAAIARNTFWLVPFGIGLTIPIIVIGSRVVTRIFDKAPWLIVLASIYLSIIAVDMVIEDLWLREYVHIESFRYFFYGIAVLVVIKRRLLTASL